MEKYLKTRSSFLKQNTVQSIKRESGNDMGDRSEDHVMVNIVSRSKNPGLLLRTQDFNEESHLITTLKHS